MVVSASCSFVLVDILLGGGGGGGGELAPRGINSPGTIPRHISVVKFTEKSAHAFLCASTLTMRNLLLVFLTILKVNQSILKVVEKWA